MHFVQVLPKGRGYSSYFLWPSGELQKFTAFAIDEGCDIRR